MAVTRRWRDVLLLIVVLLGVVAMHATVAPSGESCGPAMPHGGGHSAPPMPAAPGGSAPGECEPSSGPHHVLHLCLAVMAALLLLGLALTGLVLAWRRAVVRNPASQEVLAQARPPPRTAVRLAQLCVLRN